MKKILLLVLLAIPIVSLAQSLDAGYIYCSMYTSNIELLSNKNKLARQNIRYLILDDGVHEGKKRGEDYRLKKQDGSFVIVKSEIEAINYMAQLGWKLVQVVPQQTMDSSSPPTTYYFEKKQESVQPK